jgi:hypothetical protein
MNTYYILYGLIFVILIIIINIIQNKCTCDNDKIEHYDGKMTGLTITECGTECTKAINCVGFGYKPITRECFLAKKPVIGKPLTLDNIKEDRIFLGYFDKMAAVMNPMYSLYADEYSKLDTRCNKINNILDNKRVDGITLTENSVYMCSDGESNLATQFQYANLGGTSLEKVTPNVYDRANSDIVVPEYVSYETYHIDWPTKKRNLKQYVGKNKKEYYNNVGKDANNPHRQDMSKIKPQIDKIY